MAAGRSEREQASDHIFPRPSSQQRQHEQEQEQSPLDEKNGSFDGDGGGDADARHRPRSTVAALRDYAAGEQEEDADSNHRSWVDNIGLEDATGRMSTLQQQRKLNAFQGRVEPAAAAAGKQNSSPVNMSHIMSHVAAKDARAYSATAGRSMPEEYAYDEHAQDGDGVGGNGDDDGDGDGGQGRSPAARALTRDSEMARGARGGEEDPPDQVYIHSLAYGNLGSILPILLDRRSALEVCGYRLI